MDLYLVPLVAYVAVMVAIGVWASVRVKDGKEFMLNARRVSTPLMVTTLIATWTGAGSLIGGAGLAYRQGFSELWMSVGAWVAIVIIYRLAARVRHIAGYTLPDILERRYHPAARLLGSIALVIGCTTIVGYQFKGGAYVLEVVAGIPWKDGVALIAALVIVLTALAGMRSIVLFDLVNGIMILAGILVAVPLLLLSIGGPSAMAALPPEHTALFGGRGIVWAFSVFFPVFLLLLGEPTMYQKFFSARDERTARHACIGWVIGIIIVDMMICLLAVLGRLRFPLLGLEGHPERVILDIARSGLPAWAGCILLAAGIAVVISTANSFLLTPATNIAHDIVQRFFAPRISQRRLIMVSRIAVVLLGIAAYVLLTRFRNVLSMALAAYTMIGAGITPAILAAFFWKRATAAGGISAIVGGITGTILAKVLSDLPAAQTFFASSCGIPADELGEYIILPGFALASTLLIAISLLGKPPPQEKWKIFFERPTAR